VQRLLRQRVEASLQMRERCARFRAQLIACDSSSAAANSGTFGARMIVQRLDRRVAQPALGLVDDARLRRDRRPPWPPTRK
jgi:hypothetical protein